MTYFIGWSIFLIFFKCYLGFKVTGRENIPGRGAFILASNHSSYFDPILLGTSLRRSLYYMARENLFWKPFFGWVMRQVHAFPVKRDSGDLGAIKQAISILKDGKPLVMFPEGTRSKDRNLRPAKPGVGFIASKAGAPVVPVYIDGSLEALPGSLKTLARHPVAVYIGKPVFFDKVYKNDKEAYRKISNDIMGRIAELRDKYAGKAG